MRDRYTHIIDLAKQIERPQEGIPNHTVLQNDDVKAVVMMFAQGHELMEHTVPNPVILQFLQGEVKLTLADQNIAAATGLWLHMAAKVPQSLHATSAAMMLLLMLMYRSKPKWLSRTGSSTMTLQSGTGHI